jgi:hypothetical protein
MSVESDSGRLEQVAARLELAGMDLQNGEVHQAGKEIQDAAEALQQYLNQEGDR